MSPRSVRSTLVLALAAALAACGQKPAPAPAESATRPGPQASFVNGDFDSGTLNSWTIATNTNPSGVTIPPTSVADLHLAGGGSVLTYAVTGAAGTVIPAGLSPGASLRVPRYGTGAAVVNQTGSGTNVNQLYQLMTTTNADVDPSDNKVHVRFALAPVLNSGGHLPAEQPYFWVQLYNQTRGVMLYQTYNYTNQPGQPWKTDPKDPNTFYTDWQLFDISPGAAKLAVGDTVEMRVIAGGCMFGGHWGEIYVDAFGASIPGLQVAASGPQQVNTGANLTYGFNYSNGGTAGATSTIINATLPTGTTFVSLNAPGATCTSPSVGGTGVVSCDVGTVNPAASGSFTVTVNVDAAAGSTVALGTYDISASGVSALIGPLVNTTVTSGVTYADLGVTMSDGVAAATWGEALTYTIVATNHGPGAANGATLVDTLPAQLTGATWSCAAAGGAACSAPSGSGDISQSIPTFPSGGSVTYTLSASVIAGSGSGTVTNQATVTAPGGVTDNNLSNNDAVDSDSIGTLYLLDVVKAGTGQGTVVSSPAAISCGTACATQSASFLGGTSVVLTASAATGYAFNGWSGGGCSGSGATCTVAVNAATSVSASFGPIQWTVTGTAPGGNGTVTCASPTDNGTTSTCTIAPSAGYQLSGLTDDGVNVFAAVSGGNYLTGAVTGNKSVIGTFVIAPTVLTVSPGTTAAHTPAAAVAVDPSLTVTSGGAITGATVSIGANYAAGQDLLAFTAQGGITGSWSSGTGVLTLTGTASAATWQSVLRSVTYANSAGGGASAATRQVTFTLGGGLGYTGHFYEYVASPGITWASASAAASARRYFGLTGYLATITSAGENSFVASKLGGDGWIGASTPTFSVPRTWSWVTGPEAGTAFFTQTTQYPSSGGGSAIGSSFANWASGEPNNWSGVENYAHMYAANGTWNDFAGNNGAIAGYIVEYGGMPGDPVASVTGIKDVSVTIDLFSQTFQTDGTAGTSLTGSTSQSVLAGQSSTAVTAVPSATTYFVSWTGTNGFVTTTANPVTVSSVAAAHVLTANFAPKVVTATDLASSADPAVWGQPVHFTATVSPAPAGGTVQFQVDGANFGAAVPVSGGVAVSGSTSSLVVAGHPVTATYSGDTTDLGSSASLTQAVGKAATSAAVATAASTSYGAAVTLTATVAVASPGAGTPTGTVAFTAGGAALADCAPAAVTGGTTASCTTHLLPVGAPTTVTATYSGDAHFLASGAGSTTVTVSRGTASVAGVGAAPNPSTYGQAVTFSSSVTGGGVTPTGEVVVSAGGVEICRFTLSAGAGSCSSSTLPVTSHPVVFTFSGDANYLGAAGGVTQVVNKASSVLALGTSGDPSTYGGAVTFTATVTGPGAVGPTGAVTFTDGAATLCGGPVALDASGVATCTPPTLDAGVHPVTATYSGDASYLVSAAGRAQTVQKATPTVAVASSQQPSVYGGPVTFTTTVTGVAGGTVPPGTATFLDGAASLGTATLDAAGQGQHLRADLAPGTHPITVQYAASANYTAATSPSLAQDVTAAPTTTTLAVAPSPSLVGEPVVFSFTVTANDPSSFVPGGTVELWDGVTLVTTATLDATGHASVTRADRTVGHHAFHAVMVGNARFATSPSADVNHEVQRAPTTTAFASLLPLSTFGDSVTFRVTVTVDAPGAGTPTGDVTIREGAAPVGTVTLAGGTGTFTTATLASGHHDLVADYPGSADFLPSGAPVVSQVVDKAQPRVALALLPNPSVFGQPVVLTASVSSDVAIPGGQVVFEDGATVLATVDLDAAGVAAFTASGPLAVGAHALRARYLGAADYKTAASVPVQLTVGKAATATTLAAAPSPSVYGQPLGLTATVTVPSPGAGTPTGTVTFYDQGQPVGSGTLSAGGVATLAISSLSAGAHAFTATYQGDASFAASSGGASSHTVQAGGVLVTLTSGAPGAVFGQPIPLAIAVAAVAPAAGTPGGTVSILDGSTTLATVALSGGAASATLSTLAVGSHPLTASYGGDPAFQPGTGALTQLVAKAPTATALAAAPSPSAYGQATILTATLTVPSPGAGAPSGAVTFKDGAVSLGQGTLAAGQATLTTAALAAGSHALTAEYAGDGSFAASTGPVSHPVQKATTALALATAPAPAAFGQPVTITVTGGALAPGRGTPGGEVIVSDGGVVLGRATFDSSGVARLTVPAFSAGDHPLSAGYPGNANFTPASATAPLHVAAGSATVTVTSTRAVTRHGRPVTFTATVASPYATPAGTVTFKADGQVLGRATLSEGSASLTDRTLAKRATAYPVTAEYAPTADFDAATGTLPDGLLVENSPPVAGSGTALALGPSGASQAAIPLDGALDAGDLTLEAWAKAGWTSPAGAGAAPTVLALGGPAGTAVAIGLSPDRTQVTWSAGASSRAVAAPVDDGGWHHLAVVSTATGSTLYVDGRQADAAAGARGGTGAQLTLGEGFTGQVDEVRAWSAARTAAQLSADAMRPVAADATALAGYWRLDEGADLALYDATPGAHDGTVTLSDGAAGAFAPSQAWRLRQVRQERDMVPAADAGYDVDGDALTLTITEAAQHGLASTDQPGLQLHYLAGAGYLGTDAFTFQLDDGEATSTYQLELQVERSVACQATADCGGGDQCMQGVCVAPSSVKTTSGVGCSSGGASAGLWSLLALAGLLLRPRRSAGARRAGLAALLGLAVLAAPPARAATPAGFDVQTLEPTPAGDPLLVAPQATAAERGPAAALVLSWATEPLVLRRGNDVIPGGRMVHRQFWGWATASLPFADKVLVDVAVPVALYQSGSQPFTDLGRVSSAGVGDLRVGARWPFWAGHGVSLAAAADLWWPTGSQAAFSSDGAFRVEPKLVASGERGDWIWGASVGALIREKKDLVYTDIGPAATFTAGAAWRRGEFRVGPELWGRLQSGGLDTSPIEALVGGHWSRGAVDASLGVGTGLDRAPGAAPLRLVARVTWLPGHGEREAAAARAEAARLAAERADADRLAAEQQAAARAEASRLLAEKAEAERAAVEKAGAERLAAEKAAAEKAEADRLASEKAAAALAEANAAGDSARVRLTTEKIEILQAVQFDTDRDTIKPVSEAILKAVARVLTGHPEIARVRVEGHTDSEGSAAHNTDLSARRAAAVKRWLVEKGGIEAPRLEPEGFGPSRPVADNKTAEGRARNRRVEFKLLP